MGEEEPIFRGLVSSPVVVGRDRELAALRDAVGQPPAVVTVAGEAGIGKSRLVREVLENTGDQRALLGRCHQMRDPFPLGPVIEALRVTGDYLAASSLSPLVGTLRPLLPELGSSLPCEPTTIADTHAQRHRTFRALREVLDALGSTVCVLEDLHQGDRETLEFLSFLLSAPPRRLALILTYRPEELDPGCRIPGSGSGAAIEVCRRTIELGSLSANDVGVLASNLLQSGQVPPCSARYLHAHTDGIPFAVEQVVRLLAERGELSLLAEGRVSALGQPEVAPAIRSALLERIGRLSADAKAVACAVAVLETPATETLLRTVAGLPAARTTRAVEEGLRRGVLAERGCALYSFRHAFAAQAVYEDILTPRRQRLHLRAARALESQPEPRALALIANHFREAGRVQQWVRYTEAAAEEAHSAGDDCSAMDLLARALEALPPSRAARIRMAVALGIAALYDPSPQRAIAAVKHVLDEEDLPGGVRGELRFSLCRLGWHAGRAEGWREQMLLAVQELRRRPALAARAMINLAQPTRLIEGDVREHLHWLRQAEQTASRQEDPVALIALSMQRAAILLGVGDPAGWDAVSDIPGDGASVDESLQLRRGYHSLASAAFDLGHYSHAERFLVEAERIDADLHHAEPNVALTYMRVALDCAVGRWRGLESRARACGHRTVVAWLLVARGELAEARSTLELARTAARSIPCLADAVGALARVSLHQGDSQAACRAATDGMQVVRSKGIWAHAERIAPETVDVLLACAEHEQAAELVREFAAGLRGRDAPAATAALARCEGALREADGRYEDAARAFARAERGWRLLPRPYEAARTRERTARCVLRCDHSNGRELLLGALAEFQALGAAGTRLASALLSRPTEWSWRIRGAAGREAMATSSLRASRRSLGWCARARPTEASL